MSLSLKDEINKWNSWKNIETRIILGKMYREVFFKKKNSPKMYENLLIKVGNIVRQKMHIVKTHLNLEKVVKNEFQQTFLGSLNEALFTETAVDLIGILTADPKHSTSIVINKRNRVIFLYDPAPFAVRYSNNKTGFSTYDLLQRYLTDNFVVLRDYRIVRFTNITYAPICRAFVKQGSNGMCALWSVFYLLYRGLHTFDPVKKINKMMFNHTSSTQQIRRMSHNINQIEHELKTLGAHNVTRTSKKQPKKRVLSASRPSSENRRSAPSKVSLRTTKKNRSLIERWKKTRTMNMKPKTKRLKT